jgi:hypothetical protein
MHGRAALRILNNTMKQYYCTSHHAQCIIECAWKFCGARISTAKDNHIPEGDGSI